MEQPFIERLRALPLHQRHLILWIGSFLIFAVIFSLWVMQLKVRMAGIFESVGGRRVVIAAKEENPASSSSLLGGFFDSLKNGAASAISLFYQKEQSTNEKSVPPRVKEGNELNRFFEYQPFPKE